MKLKLDKVYKTNPHTEEEIKERKRKVGSSQGGTAAGGVQPISYREFVREQKHYFQHI
jgi:hypothetical protein